MAHIPFYDVDNPLPPTQQQQHEQEQNHQQHQQQPRQTHHRPSDIDATTITSPPDFSPPPPSFASTSPSYDRPSRPSLATDPNCERYSSNAHSASAASSLSAALAGPSPGDLGHFADADGFYRRYRDSFRARGPNGIYSLSHSSSNAGNTEAMASVLPPRASHFDNRKPSGNASPSTASVSVRVNNLAGKASAAQDANKEKKDSAATVPRGRQASVKAFVSKFEQRADEVISMPGSKPGSRSTSANDSPSTPFSARSFRSRTPSRANVEDRYGARRKSGTERIPEPPAALNIQKKLLRKASTEPRTLAAATTTTATVAPAVSTSRVASATEGPRVLGTGVNERTLDQQYTANVPSEPLAIASAQRPLFGEIVAGQGDFGWGIPDMRHSMASSSSGLSRPASLFRDDTQLDLSPISPSGWYRQPTFEGFDSTRLPAPTTADPPLMQHKRSRSDLYGLNHTLNQIPPSLTAGMGKDEIPTQAVQNASGRSPGLSRSISYANDTAASRVAESFSEHMSRESHGSALRPAADSSHVSIATDVRTPHRSARHAALSIDTDSNPRFGAQTSDVSPSAKSPPLRNSRNRPSLATASTASSRGKIVERSKTVGSGSSPSRKHPRKNLPELGTVDFAARRERIQRAFSKSVEEKEAEQRRSLILEAQRRKNEPEEAPSLPPVPTIDARHYISHQARGPEHDHPRKDSETLAATDTKPHEDEEAKREELVDGGASFISPPLILQPGSADDSPTLGTVEHFPSSNLPSLSTPSEGGSSDSTGNYFETRPAVLDGQAPTEALTGVSAELSPRPQPESIHIVLGEGQPPIAQPRQARTGPEVPFESRWSMSSWASSTDSNHRYSAAGAGDVRLESIHEVHDVQEQPKADQSSPPDAEPTVQEHEASRRVSEPADDDSPSSQRPSRTAQWMVDQSIVPPRSFAQETGSNAASNHNTASGARKTQPTSAAGVTGLRRADTFSDEKQTHLSSLGGQSLAPESSFNNATANFFQRASLMNPADFNDASPSIGDWIAVQAQDTPVEERSPLSFSDRRESSTPSKKITGLRSRTPKMVDGPQLPEIPPIEGGLGINIDAASPSEDAQQELPQQQQQRQQHQRASESTLQSRINISQSADQPLLSVANSRLSISPSKASSTRPSSDQSVGNATEGSNSRPRSAKSQATANSEEPRAGLAEVRPMINGQQDATTSKPLTEEEQKARDTEQKRLTRRKNIIKELVDTESSFGQDMTVVVDIYKETSHVILQNPDDVKILFGNAAEIVTFSTNFLDALKGAVSPVYKLPRSKRWRTKRDSSATTESSLADETSSISNLELSEDERDRMTTIGAAFEQNLLQMEKVYTDYLKNHEQANNRLTELIKSDKVQIWLNECRAYAHDLTTAWSLDSLLVKPVQRILKYPLLLRELADVTPENHPDFNALDAMTREIVGVSKRINAAKKRADLVEQAHGTVKKDKRKKDERSAIAKAFGRNKEKLKQQVGLSDIIQDKTYNILADKFGSHFFQVQVVMRDIEMYTVDIQSSVKKFESFVSAIEEHMDVAQSPYPEIESKWRLFRQAARELQLTALTDHVNNVREHVIQPMKTLLKYYEGPQRMMEKRKKRVLDHARWKQLQDVGGRIDKKLIEQGEQFVAINDTLKEELPVLFAKTKQLVEQCLNIFVQLQLQWQTIWRRKLSQAVDARQLPKSAQDIIDAFNSDFKYTEAQVLSLAICNGALKDDDSLQLNHSGTGLSSSATTLNGDEASSRQTSITFEDVRDQRHSAHGRTRAASSNSQSATFHTAYYPAAYAQGPSSRDRASSATSARRSEQYQWSGGQGHLGVVSPPQSATSSGRPSSQSARANSGPYGQNPYDPSSYSRYSDDSSRGSHWYSSLSYSRHSSGRPSDSQYGIGAALAGAAGAAAAAANPRGSAVFSSAMPPSDTTPPPSAPLSQPYSASRPRFDPNAEHERQTDQSQPHFNVLFLAASVYEFNIDRARREAGYPYLTYAAGEIFDVIGEKGELWLAKNQDDSSNTLGWIWNKHFAKLANEH